MASSPNLGTPTSNPSVSAIVHREDTQGATGSSTDMDTASPQQGSVSSAGRWRGSNGRQFSNSSLLSSSRRRRKSSSMDEEDELDKLEAELPGHI